MKNRHFVAIMVLTTLMLGACKSEKKITTYNDIYSEKPVTILIAPVADLSQRKQEKYPRDIEHNNELNTAALYLYQKLPVALKSQGYYVVGGLAAQQIAKQEALDRKQYASGDLKRFAQYYGIDAVLLTTIHRWADKNGEWALFVEYQLRSTKSGNDLLHTWVKASKQIATDFKGDPVALKSDKDFATDMNIDNGSAQRCILVKQVSDYVLSDLPVSPLKRQYERDRYANANAAYFSFIFNQDGEIEIEKTSMEAFEEDCFVE